jgi:hypothetical protein
MVALGGLMAGLPTVIIAYYDPRATLVWPFPGR